MSGNDTPVESTEVDFSLDGLSIDDFKSDKKRSEKEQAIIQGGDEDELERFRQEWRAEVKGRKGLGREAGVVQIKAEWPKRSGKQPDTAPKSPEIDQSPKKTTTSPIAGTARLPKSFPDRSPTQTARSLDAGPSRPKKAYSAVQLYAQAVENEQSGQLNDALMLYRRAFKIDGESPPIYYESAAHQADNVDRVYQKSLPKYAPEEEETETPTSTDIVSAAVPQDEAYSFQRHLQFQPDYEKTKTARKRSPLSILIDKASVPPQEAEFKPEEEDKPFPLALLPPELLEPIFNNLDVRALERFGTTCWHARLLSSRADIWKRRVQTLCRWPMVQEGISANELVERHDGEWRTTFIEEERVRMDGCYISVCHYVRPGSGDEWVAVTHMITYHRFLRFYPDGSVISYLTTDQ